MGAAALLLGVLPLTACSDGGSVGSGGGTFVAALDELPQPSGERRLLQVTWADLDAVREANGGDVIGGGEDAVVLAVPGELEQRGDTVSSDLGFDLTGSDRVASVRGESSALGWYRAADDIEPGADLEEVDGDDDLYRRGDDLYASIDGREAVLTSDDGDARDWRSGDATTLADDDAVTDVARAIDEAGAVSATIIGLADDRLVGIGWVDDDGEAAYVLVYGLGSDDAARDAEDTIADGFGDLGDQVEVDDVEVDGSLVVVSGHQVDGVSAPLRLLETLRLPLPE